MSGFTINRACMSGNLTRDPELRSLPSGTAVCKIGIAVNERYKDNATGQWEDRPNFFDWTIWGGLGEWIAKNLSKGDGVAVEGRARWHSWETTEGQKRSAVDFVADSIVPIGKREGGGGQQQARNEAAAGADFEPAGGSDIPSGDFVAAGAGAATGDFTAPATDDDIPF